MRRRITHALPALIVITVAGGCSDESMLAPNEGPAVFTRVGATPEATQCLAAPDVVVRDAAALHAAIASAQPGTSIAIEGMIAIPDTVVVVVPGLTLGCASPGSGLTVAPGAETDFLLFISAPDVTIQGLVLDGAVTTHSPLYTQPLDPEHVPSRLRVAGNQVTCGPNLCAFFVGAPDVVVTDNVFEANGAGGGLHMQAHLGYGPDRVRIERNRIVQLGVSQASPMLSGIRITTGADVVVADNVIQGAWVRGIGLNLVTGGRFMRNRIEGVQEFGILGSTNPGDPSQRFAANVVEHNAITGAGQGGVHLTSACGNTVVANQVRGAGPAVLLASASGANDVSPPVGVVDDGYVDCDGDRLADFNVVNGRTTLETRRPEIPSKEARACLIAPDFVVHDDAELRTALQAAAPWQSIALDGLIALGSEVRLEKPALTLGCATPGSGFSRAEEYEGEPWDLLWVRAPDVTLRGLRFDGALTWMMPVYADDDGGLPWANVRLRFVGNEVAYGEQGGMFTAGAQSVTVTDNHFLGQRAQYAVHIQYQGHGSRVERNVMSVDVGAFLVNPLAAAIRFRDGDGGRVADNVIRGPWVRGINVAELWDNDIVGNTIEGVLTYGIRTGVNWIKVNSVHDNRIRDNRIRGAGLGAILLQQACSNALLGNQMDGNDDGIGAVFDVSTGLNVLTGNTVTALDNGSFDCTGDGVVDPNIITGKGKVKNGIPPGEVLGQVMPRGPRALR
jgi:nitrous oxidase accessory protein NosD